MNKIMNQSDVRRNRALVIIKTCLNVYRGFLNIKMPTVKIDSLVIYLNRIDKKKNN